MLVGSPLKPGLRWESSDRRSRAHPPLSRRVESRFSPATFRPRKLALRRDYEALTQLGERYLLSTVAGELARVLYAQGRLDEAEKCSRHAQELADPDDIASTTLWRTVQAKHLAQKGNRDAALILIGEAVDLLRRTDSVVAQAETLVDLAEVLRLAGRRKEADDVLEGAVELFEAKGNVAAVEALRVPAASS